MVRRHAAKQHAAMPDRSAASSSNRKHWSLASSCHGPRRSPFPALDKSLCVSCVFVLGSRSKRPFPPGSELIARCSTTIYVAARILLHSSHLLGQPINQTIEGMHAAVACIPGGRVTASWYNVVADRPPPSMTRDVHLWF